MEKIYLSDGMRISKKKLAAMLRKKEYEVVTSLDGPVDWFVAGHNLSDIHPLVREFRQKHPEADLVDEYELYARIWDSTFLANLIEEKLESSLWGKRVWLMGRFSDGEKKKVGRVLKQHHGKMAGSLEEANLFLLGKYAYDADPEAFVQMLRQKAVRPAVKIIGRHAFQQKGEEAPFPHKKKRFGEKEKLYFGHVNPRTYPSAYVALDLEATSDSRSNKVIEIGMVRVRDGQEVAAYQSFVNPHERLKPVIKELTNIDDVMLKDAPDIQAIMKEVLQFLGDDPVAGHSVQNDMKLLAENLNMPLDNNYIDTCKVALTMLPEREKYSLRSLAEDYGLVQSTHRALDDARTSHELLEKFRELFAGQK